MNAGFDRYAADYDATLNRALKTSGENADYFARRRVQWLAKQLRKTGRRVSAVLDFGCGHGSTAPLLRSELNAERVVGIDPSAESIALARQNHSSSAEFLPLDEYQPAHDFDLVYCNGVFHHIAPNERSAALGLIRGSLRAGGLFALWENNPWNPGTRWIMSRCDFDADAIPISASAARRLLRRENFQVRQTDFLFVFPRWLRALRVVEPALSAWPLGAQYQILSAV